MKKPKEKTLSNNWVCGCGHTLPARILFCSRCGHGQKKSDTADKFK